MSSLSTAISDVTGLYSIFDRANDHVPRARFISEGEMPEPYRGLLAHHDHMTVTMEKFCSAPVDLQILKSVREDKHYARKILLANSESNRVVMYGIMRFNFDWCTDDVKEEIISGRTPLGRILIENDILRRISTHALLKLTPNMEMRACFGLRPPLENEDGPEDIVYGRLATIFCNDEPAVDLLEVPSPVAG